MNRFGVVEVQSTRTTAAPGWAYVPDLPGTKPAQSVASIAPGNRKRNGVRFAANNSTSTAHAAEQAARIDSKLQKELEHLQRDTLRVGGGGGDIHVPGGRGAGKTPNTRKILASQKTFANHLDDYEAAVRVFRDNGFPNALLGPVPALSGSGAGGIGGAGAGGAGTATPTTLARSHSKGGGAAGRSGTVPHRKGAAAAAKEAAAAAAAKAQAAKPPKAAKGWAYVPVEEPEDVVMTEAPPIPTETGGEPVVVKTEQQTATTTTISPAEIPAIETAAHPISSILAPSTKPPVAAHPGDNDPLLVSWLPPLPTDDELRDLLAAPPLSYKAARGVWSNSTTNGKMYPQRQFCVVCGYWGRVKCTKCETRVCALECLEMHREECVTRYGA